MRAQAPAIPAPAAAVSLPFTSAEGMIFIDVTVDGHSYHMLFDTGSAFTHIGRSTGPVIRRRGPGLHRSEAHQIQCDLAAQLPADSHRLQISHTGASAMITLVLLTAFCCKVPEENRNTVRAAGIQKIIVSSAEENRRCSP